jgi:uncharacterized protein (TIGR02118 family)
MLKFVNVLVRQDGMSHEEFVERWTGSHAELAGELPGLRQYTTSVPADPDRADYDGVVELYFDDMGALKSAFESEIGREVTADAAEFVDRDAGATRYLEETVQLDRVDATDPTGDDGAAGGR